MNASRTREVVVAISLSDSFMTMAREKEIHSKQKKFDTVVDDSRFGLQSLARGPSKR